MVAGGQRDSEEGSALMLLPAGLLVLLVLAAAAVDSAVAFAGQREAAALAASAAADVIVAAADVEAFYTDDGVLELHEADVRSVAETVVADSGSSAVEVTTVEAVCDDEDGLAVTVSVEGYVEVVFAPSVAGMGHRAVAASSTATAVDGTAFDVRCVR